MPNSPRPLSRPSRRWLLGVLATSWAWAAWNGQKVDEPVARSSAGPHDLAATLSPEEILGLMSAALQGMDTLSVTVDGFWYGGLQGGDTNGSLILARPGKASWVEESNAFGVSVESLVTDGSPDGMLRWAYYPDDNTYRLRSDTAEDWGLSPDKELTRHLPLAGVLFHGGALGDWSLLGFMSAIAGVLPEGVLIHPPGYSMFPTEEALTTPWYTDMPPECDCFGVQLWQATQYEGESGEGSASRIRLWVGKDDNLPRRLEHVSYLLRPGHWDPEDPFALVKTWGGIGLPDMSEEEEEMGIDLSAPILFSIRTEKYSEYITDEPVPEETFLPHIPPGATLVEDPPLPPMEPGEG